IGRGGGGGKGENSGGAGLFKKKRRRPANPNMSHADASLVICQVFFALPRQEHRCTSCTLLSSLQFAFFFQAEDGIRDLTVTGVQTCALPIFATWGRSGPSTIKQQARYRDEPA